MDWINGLVAQPVTPRDLEKINPWPNTNTFMVFDIKWWWWWQCSADAAADDDHHQEWVEEYVNQHLKDPGIMAMLCQIYKSSSRPLWFEKMLKKWCALLLVALVGQLALKSQTSQSHNQTAQLRHIHFRKQGGWPNSDFVTSWKNTRTGMYAYRRSVPTLSSVFWFLTVSCRTVKCIPAIRKGF